MSDPKIAISNAQHNGITNHEGKIEKSLPISIVSKHRLVCNEKENNFEMK